MLFFCFLGSSVLIQSKWKKKSFIVIYVRLYWKKELCQTRQGKRILRWNPKYSWMAKSTRDPRLLMWASAAVRGNEETHNRSFLGSSCFCSTFYSSSNQNQSSSVTCLVHCLEVFLFFFWLRSTGLKLAQKIFCDVLSCHSLPGAFNNRGFN